MSVFQPRFQQVRDGQSHGDEWETKLDIIRAACATRGQNIRYRAEGFVPGLKDVYQRIAPYCPLVLLWCIDLTLTVNIPLLAIQF